MFYIFLPCFFLCLEPSYIYFTLFPFLSAKLYSVLSLVFVRLLYRSLTQNGRAKTVRNLPFKVVLEGRFHDSYLITYLLNGAQSFLRS